MSGSTDGGVDASIPLQAGKGVTQNPLASSSPAQILNVLNTLNQLKLFPGQLQQQQLGIQQSQTQLQGSQLALLQNKVNVFNGAMSPLIRLGANVTPKDVYSTVAGLHAAGFPTDEFVADMADTMPVLAPADAADPKARAAYGQQLQSWVLNHAARTWDPGTQASAFRPNIDMVNTGGNIRPVDTNAYTNPGIASMPPIGGTLTPAQAVAQVPGPVGPKGQQTVIPAAQYAKQSGYGGVVAPGTAAPAAAPGAAPGTAGPASAFPNNGRIAAPQSQGGPQAAPQGAAAPGQQMAAPGQPMTTALGPGQTAAMHTAGGIGGQQVADLYTAANDVPARQGMLTAMLGDLTRASTGPNTPEWSNLMGRMVQAGLPVPGGADAQASRENFAKMASRFAQLQASQLGVITNDKLATAIISNPNEVFTTLGNQGVIHVFQGNEDALSAKAQAWSDAQQHGTAPDDFPQWSQQFNKKFDPRVFWLARMSPTERTTLMDGMSAADQKRFLVMPLMQ